MLRLHKSKWRWGCINNTRRVFLFFLLLFFSLQFEWKRSGSMVRENTNIYAFPFMYLSYFCAEFAKHYEIRVYQKNFKINKIKLVCLFHFQSIRMQASLNEYTSRVLCVYVISTISNIISISDRCRFISFYFKKICRRKTSLFKKTKSIWIIKFYLQIAPHFDQWNWNDKENVFNFNRIDHLIFILK